MNKRRKMEEHKEEVVKEMDTRTQNIVPGSRRTHGSL
jgi:hypothetical protein